MQVHSTSPLATIVPGRINGIKTEGCGETGADSGSEWSNSEACLSPGGDMNKPKYSSDCFYDDFLLPGGDMPSFADENVKMGSQAPH